MRSETLSIIHGMRYLKLDVCTYLCLSIYEKSDVMVYDEPYLTALLALLYMVVVFLAS